MTTPAGNLGYVVYRKHIPEEIVPGKRLGRHIKRDSRSLRYAYRSTMPAEAAKDVLWQRHIPILDQGDVGSCTGNEEVGCLGTGPLWDSLPGNVRITLNEHLALSIYSDAEMIDGDGPYPPNDNGSTGTSVAQVALNRGLISGYTHAASVSEMVDALQHGSVGVGGNWYDSMDHPDSNGFVSISPNAYVRGGHEFEVRGVRVADKLFFADNSWGTVYASSGSFTFSFDTMDRLFSEQGDCTVCVPLSQPAPVPTPNPTDPDHILWFGGGDSWEYGGASEWVQHHHTGANHALQKDLLTWAHAKGLT